MHSIYTSYVPFTDSRENKTYFRMDDIIITGNDNKLIHSLVSQMNSVFSLKDLGEFDYFLGIEV